MPVSSFQPTDLDREQDPYPIFARLREGSPIQKLQSGFWAVTGHAAALETLKSPACRSGPIALRYLAGLPEGAARNEMGRRINFLDPPDHTRVRGLVSKAFTAKRIAELRPWIEATAERLLDGLGGAGEIDLLESFAHQLPSLVISEMLGVPIEDRQRLTAFSDAVAPLLGVSLSEAAKARAVAAAEEFHQYLGALMEERKRSPAGDLLSALIAAEEAGERISHAELLSLAATLYSAGHRTTRDLFGNGMFTLLRKPERYRSVVEGTWGAPEVVEEFLRFETPTLFVARFAGEPATIAGARVGAGEPLLIYLAAANRDPAAYPNPDAFLPGRPGPAALSFAHGAHYCLGAPLARLEAEVMLAAVARRWPGLELSGEPPRWRQSGPFRGLESLRVGPG